MVKMPAASSSDNVKRSSVLLDEGRCFSPKHTDKESRAVTMRDSCPADIQAGRKILCKRFSTKSRMALESRADSGLNPLITESHGGQNGMRAGTA